MTAKFVFAFVLLAASMVALATLLLYQGIIRFNYPSFARYPVQGVDISHHQGPIDWPRLKSRQAQFAYLKASEGATFKDPTFGRNWKGALAADILPGAYHFFTLCKTGPEQAANFLSAAAWTKADGLPPAVDLEFGGNCGRRPPVTEFSAELQAFLDAVENAWGCQPILYVTPEFYYPYVAPTFRSHRLWVRDVFKRPSLGDGRDWRLWQFANRGRLAGVETFIDLNVFNGSIQDFATFRCGAAQRGVQHLSDRVPS